MSRSARHPAGTAATAPVNSGTDEAKAAFPTVIYIAGSGRSGSTLLERVLGGMPGAVNVGELIDLFRRTAPLGERCGCGLAFPDCPFWSKVGERAFGGWDASQMAGLERLRNRVARQRYLPRLLAMPAAVTADHVGRCGGCQQVLVESRRCRT